MAGGRLLEAVTLAGSVGVEAGVRINVVVAAAMIGKGISYCALTFICLDREPERVQVADSPAMFGRESYLTGIRSVAFRSIGPVAERRGMHS